MVAKQRVKGNIVNSNETTPLHVHENHFHIHHVESEEHDTQQLINNFKEDKQQQKKDTSAQNLNCTFMSLAAFILLGAIWGSAFSFIKVAVDPKTGFTPIATVFLRLVIGGVPMVGLLVIACIRDRQLYEQVKQNRQMRTILKMMVMGFFNNSVPFTLVGIAEQYVNSGVASILDSSIPLFCIIYAHFALGGAERMTVMKFLGLAIGFAGVILVCCEQVIKGGSSLRFEDFYGYIMVTGAAASYGIASVYAKKYLKNVPSLFVAAGQIVSATLQMLVVWLIVDVGFEESHLKYFKRANWISWVSIGYLSLCSTFLAYLCYFYLIKTVGSVKQSMVGYLLPVFGVAEGAIFLNEWKGVPWYLILLEIVGAILVCGGIALVSLPNAGSVINFFTRWYQVKKISDNDKMGDSYKSGDNSLSGYDYEEPNSQFYYQTDSGHKNREPETQNVEEDEDEGSSGFTPM